MSWPVLWLYPLVIFFFMNIKQINNYMIILFANAEY